MSSWPQRRPISILFLLLLLQLTLLSIQVRTSQGDRLIRVVGITVISPFSITINAVGGLIGDLSKSYFFLRSADNENRRLREENASLQLEVLRLRGVASALPRLEGIRQMLQQSEFDGVVVSVVGRGTPFYAGRLLIGQGSLQGVKLNQPILAEQAALGRVVTLSPLVSEAELLTNSGAAAGALLEKSRFQGVIMGDGTSMLRLEFIPNSEPVEVGDRILTSGTDGIYPKDVPLGKVVSISPGDMTYQDIVVEPFFDVHRLEEVVLLKRIPRETPQVEEALEDGREREAVAQREKSQQ